MKRLILLFALALLCGMASACAEVRYVDGLDADRVHLRQLPDASSDSLGLYFTGAAAEASDRVGDWTRVRIGTENGWMQTRYLSGDAARREMPVLRVDHPGGSYVNLRQGPGTDKQILTRIDSGERVMLLGETADGWSLVEYEGLTGYMLTGMLKQTEATSESRIVGRGTDGSFIHEWLADNGQRLYFTAWEEAPVIERRDVNFDGRSDVVVQISRGVSNVYSILFVREGSSYVMADVSPFTGGLANVAFRPDVMLVTTHANNGGAGALHEDCIFRWEGSRLVLLRRAVGEYPEETALVGDRMITTVRTDAVQLTVLDHTRSAEGTVLWETVAGQRQLEEGSVLQQEEAALWQGLK